MTIRSATYREWQNSRLIQQLQPLFDEGVTLARRLRATDPPQAAALLARALTDRATFLIATGRRAEAHADFQEATTLSEQL
ncbi:hypothetical protein GXW82_24685 [Streptacidiphilus sp. 4-A2]|nr:hypothetical protein [Streptacidiphilus sp. 4-A2]